jgi:methylthioribose-1-phosphate isomerase
MGIKVPTPLRTLWEHKESIAVIDQRRLPHELIVEELSSLEDCVRAIKEMIVRGAPLIACTAAYGVYFGLRIAKSTDALSEIFTQLRNSRPTAVNLFNTMDRMERELLASENITTLTKKALDLARTIVEEDVEICRMIGVNGLPLLEELHQKNPNRPINILTHCNAGMLGCIEWGTISSPIYQAKAKGIPVHVWVDETRPRNQGANLTAWELTKHDIPHTLIVDNTGGHLMQQGLVDLVIVGADRVTKNGDTANKIGTYLKALAAKDNDVPFYVALPSTTIDWKTESGKSIEIEERSPDEVKYVWGKSDKGEFERVLICPEKSKALNIGFDITPSRLITALITDRGNCLPTEENLLRLFPEYKNYGY